MNPSEAETLIVFVEADEEASVFTCRRTLWPVCERAGGRLIRSGIRKKIEETREYLVPLAMLYRVFNRLGSELQDESSRKKKREQTA